MNKLRPDALYDLKPLTLLQEHLAKANYIYAGCINCENFNEPSELCKIANARPPIRVILFGCPKWVFDGIPF